MKKNLSYRRYLEGVVGCRVQKVAVNVGMGCPNRDGTLATGGCTFCVNEAFTPSYCSPEKSIKEQVETGINFHKRRYARSSAYLVYFQSFSNTYAPLDRLQTLYEEALDHPDVVGLVIGTRPDCVDEEKLDYIAQLAQRTKYLIVEYGIESVYDRTLERINRGHDFQTARRAVEMTAQRGLHCGAHFIVGLPGESNEDILRGIDIINTLPLSTIKFHQLQLFAGTKMVDDYLANPDDFHLFGLDEYLDFYCDIFARLRDDIIVERFASEAPPRYLYGDHHWQGVRYERLVQLLEQKLKQRGILL